MMTPAANDSGDDLAILYPDRTATIAGVPVTMHEYTFVEGMRLGAHVAPIVAGIAASAAAGTIANVDALNAVFAANAEHVRALVAASSGQPVEWLDALNDVDGQALQLLWWTVNAPFFGRRVVQHLLAQDVAALAGRTSTLHSPATATAPTALPPTRVVN